MSAQPARALMSIGEVLARLRPEFCDITISKIRFLESEGLIEPQRSPSGYRKFTHADIERLRYVLSAQRDHYLPLRVIREHLEASDRGLAPPLAGMPGPRPLVAADSMPAEQDFTAEDRRLTRRELLEATGLDDQRLRELEDFGLVVRDGRHYDAEAVAIVKTVVELGRFGLEARHLRAVKAAADREIGLVEQVVTPLVRQRDPGARGRADDAAREIAALSLRLHAALMKVELGRSLNR
ncbi:MAG: MerR family DNA-binding transcriptional regulator [Streptosporangiales bacterium]|nr:MerR family DNA-binding transcriptional regulator [Streptosporangiales bacterium]